MLFVINKTRLTILSTCTSYKFYSLVDTDSFCMYDFKEKNTQHTNSILNIRLVLTITIFNNYYKTLLNKLKNSKDCEGEAPDCGLTEKRNKRQCQIKPPIPTNDIRATRHCSRDLEMTILLMLRFFTVISVIQKIYLNGYTIIIKINGLDNEEL